MNITLHSAQLVEQNSHRAWMLAISIEGEDGLRAMVLPVDAAEWRTAELGLDVDDREMWELIIFEQMAGAAPFGETRDGYLARVGKVRGAITPPRKGVQPVRAAGPRMKVVAESADDPIGTMARETPRRSEHVEARRVIVQDAPRGSRPQQVSSDEMVLANAERIRKNQETR